MSDTLPDRYRRYSVDLVECQSCASGSIIPATAIPEHELWHSGPNVRTAAHPSAPWPALTGAHPTTDGPRTDVARRFFKLPAAGDAVRELGLLLADELGPQRLDELLHEAETRAAR